MINILYIVRQAKKDTICRNLLLKLQTSRTIIDKQALQ